jgi:hypothetical protein
MRQVAATPPRSQRDNNWRPAANGSLTGSMGSSSRPTS